MRWFPHLSIHVCRLKPWATDGLVGGGQTRSCLGGLLRRGRWNRGNALRRLSALTWEPPSVLLGHSTLPLSVLLSLTALLSGGSLLECLSGELQP